jgi:hypothetical protein
MAEKHTLSQVQQKVLEKIRVFPLADGNMKKNVHKAQYTPPPCLAQPICFSYLSAHAVKIKIFRRTGHCY